MLLHCLVTVSSLNCCVAWHLYISISIALHHLVVSSGCIILLNHLVASSHVLLCYLAALSCYIDLLHHLLHCLIVLHCLVSHCIVLLHHCCIVLLNYLAASSHQSCCIILLVVLCLFTSECIVLCVIALYCVLCCVVPLVRDLSLLFRTTHCAVICIMPVCDLFVTHLSPCPLSHLHFVVLTLLFHSFGIVSTLFWCCLVPCFILCVVGVCLLLCSVVLSLILKHNKKFNSNIRKFVQNELNFIQLKKLVIMSNIDTKY